MNSCANCFHQFKELREEPCNSCKGHTNWVSVDVFKNISDHSKVVIAKQIPEDGVGVKYDNDKPQWSLLPFKALKEVVDVLTYGAKKYAPDNWKKVPDARQRYIDAGFRHFTAYAGGEKNDSETGMSHLAHATCCMLFLMSFDKDDSLKDRDE